MILIVHYYVSKYGRFNFWFVFVKAHQQPIKDLKKKKERKTTVQNSPLTNLICETTTRKQWISAPIAGKQNCNSHLRAWLQYLNAALHLPCLWTSTPPLASAVNPQTEICTNCYKTTSRTCFFQPQRINKSRVLQIITTFYLSTWRNILQCFVSSDFKGNYSFDLHDLKNMISRHLWFERYASIQLLSCVNFSTLQMTLSSNKNNNSLSMWLAGAVVCGGRLYAITQCPTLSARLLKDVLNRYFSMHRPSKFPSSLCLNTTAL